MPQPSKGSEPIPGYVLSERIGVGGYGEVWSAEAPGGLSKAIKFVYGFFDDSRASRELKALDRIKQVRHPFLLSLERFEVVDGQLIIVTELADQSLKDRFEQAKLTGTAGIPRDELLAHLRDAADALDYMSENFSLQHLDVKPENLLLVGGRMKVADFGLVKNLHDVAASMMGGLTPIYAAPEVFDDRPSSYSDQYSLAIVYQEMLSGHLPFPGRTPAQLAAQHLHASPRLASLPPADQLIINQALAKNHVERFPSARAMVDALVEANQPKRPGLGSLAGQLLDLASTTDTASIKSQSDTDSRTQILGGQSGSSYLDEAVAVPATAVEPVAELGPLDVSQAPAGLRPTLYIGIGGTGGRALRRLRRRLNDRFGSAAAVPSIQMLEFDTDGKSLYAAPTSDRESPLADGETMLLALRSAREYTADSRNMMQWLSRRWLYSIPRSLQTEGRRPLGRLALVDHASQLIERIVRAVREINAPEAIAATTAANGLPMRTDMPRIVVIASASGGTGGGMALDVAQTVRQILDKLGMSSDAVSQIFTHSTDRNPTKAELATANAYAFLTELQHYNALGYKPGETAVGLPRPAHDRGGLANSYFVHLGHSLNEPEFDASIDELAAYVYLSTATEAAGVFDLCRNESADDLLNLGLRSFALTTIGCTSGSLPAQVAEMACRQVVQGWRDERAANDLFSLGDAQPIDEPQPPTPAEMAALAANHAASLDLALEPLQAIVAPLVARQFGADAEWVISRLNAGIDPALTPVERIRKMTEALRGQFDPTAISDDGHKPVAATLVAALETSLKPLAAPKGRAISEWILEFVNSPATRVAGALLARKCYVARLHEVETECAALLLETQQQLQSCQQLLAEGSKAAPARSRWFGGRRADSARNAELDDLLLLAAELRLEECTLLAAAKLLKLVGSGVSAAGDALKEVQHRLGQWLADLDGPSPWDALEAAPSARLADEMRLAATRDLRDRMPGLVRELDDHFEQTFLTNYDGLRAVCLKADGKQESLLLALRTAARTAVVGAMGQFPLGPAVFGVELPEATRQARLQPSLEAARPKFTDCGGSQRLLIVLPPVGEAADLPATVSAQFTPAATVATHQDAAVVFCYEQQQLSLAHVAARLIDGRNDIIQVAGRLHTRVDIPWSQLPQPTPELAVH